MTDLVAEIVLRAVEMESDSPVGLDDPVALHADSLGMVSIAIEIMNTYDNIALVEDKEFSTAVTVRDLIRAVERAVQGATE